MKCILKEILFKCYVMNPIVTIAGSDPSGGAGLRGDQFTEDAVIQALIDDMIPLAHLITPNLKEAELLTGISVDDDRSLIKACKKLLSFGCESVLITSCKLIDDENAVDYFADSNTHHWF